MKPFCRTSSQKGSTLIEVLVGFGLLGICVVFISQGSNYILGTKTSAELLRQRALLKTLLLSSVSCLDIAPCKDKETRDLLDAEGRFLVKKDGSLMYGAWQPKAICQADNTIEVRVTAPVSGGFKADPLTQKPLDLKHPTSVLVEAGVLCCEINAKDMAQGIFPVTGAHCPISKGTCPPPDRSRGVFGAPDRMCCEDGRDMPKPKCPNRSREIAAYWDREEDWGAEGKWVVLCL